MKTLKFQSKDEWMLARRGRITGTRLKDVIVRRGSNKKIGYYELIAERLATSPTGEDPIERGLRLEEEAIDKYQDMIGKMFDIDLVIWARDDNDNIAVSPDGFTETEAVEVKCLSSARHIEAYLTQDIGEYKDQVMQYFIVNDKIEIVHVLYYDPRIPVKDIFAIKVEREDIKDEIQFYLDYQIALLKGVNEVVNKLTF